MYLGLETGHLEPHELERQADGYTTILVDYS